VIAGCINFKSVLAGLWL